MVLVISESSDDSTNSVLDWISYFKKEFVRINRDTMLSNAGHSAIIELNSNSESLKIEMDDQEQLDLAKINSVWFRRSLYPYLDDFSCDDSSKEFYSKIAKNFYHEYVNCASFIFSSLEKGKRKLGNFRNYRLNKIEVLNLARSMGIDIPATLITNKKKQVETFLLNKDKLITKSISEIFDIRVSSDDNEEVYLNYTEEITTNVLDKIPETFAYSLFQEKLDKDLEIRAFYLNGKVYSMAIFSQLGSTTSIDFRKDFKNRRVPYQLSSILEEKITNLMERIGLNTGSIDFVKTNDSRIVFLEINPTGQYGMTSYPCNYHLDKEISKYLINNG